MSVAWNAERVLALAPDPASVKAGQALGSARKWVSLGRGDGLIWGECQGSGKDPYQTKVDPDEPAYSCSCPSRKFPCKHALGLMLVWASGPDAIAESALPAWVASWLEGRAKRAEAKREKAERGPAPVDLVAQAKREAARRSKVTAGLDDLALWLADLVRQGFSTLSAKSATLWDEQARRMVDAQAPGIARRLGQIDDMSRSGDGWQASLLDRLGRIHLIIEGFRRIDRLPPDVADDVRTAIGFPADLDAVRAGDGVRDRWQVIGQGFAVEERILVRRTWLLGRDSRRPALVLDFAAAGRPLDAAPMPGTEVDAEVSFFPGRLGLRALIKDGRSVPEETRGVAGTTIAGAFASFGEALARCPWLELWPVVVEGVVLENAEEGWSLRDGDGSVLPLSRGFSMGWPLLARAGGVPMTVAGEFDGATLTALGAWAGAHFVSLVTQQTPPQNAIAPAPPVASPLLSHAAVSALVGVDRKPPPLPAGSGALAAALRGIEPLAPASRLLAVTAATCVHDQAGRKPSRAAGPALAPCPPETQPECPAPAADRLRRMLGGEHAPVLREWFERVAAPGLRVPHDAIVDVLAQQGNLKLPVDALSRALGTRGRWLAGLNPQWRRWAGIEESSDPAVVWETGTRHERLAALRTLRARDPHLGLALLKSTFANEPADFRAAILDELNPGKDRPGGLSMDDEPFLEQCLDDRSKEVRERAARLLHHLPESRLAQRMAERARAVLSWEPAADGRGRGPLSVALPAAVDAAMVRDGMIAARPKEQKGDRAGWLEDIMLATPPSAIGQFLDATPAEIIDGARQGDWFSVLVDDWIAAAVSYGDAEWAEALFRPDVLSALRSRTRSSWASDLCRLLRDEKRQDLAMQVFGAMERLHHDDVAVAVLETLDRPITTDLARVVLAPVYRLIAHERAVWNPDPNAPFILTSTGMGYDRQFHDHETPAMIELLADILPFDVADEAADGFALGDAPHPLYGGSFAAMIERLKFRRDMHRELTS